MTTLPGASEDTLVENPSGIDMAGAPVVAPTSPPIAENPITPPPSVEPVAAPPTPVQQPDRLMPANYDPLMAETQVQQGDLPRELTKGFEQPATKHLTQEEYAAQNPTFLDTANAAFMEYNVGAQALSSFVYGKATPSNMPDPGFNAWEKVKGTPEERYYDSHYDGIVNEKYFNHVRDERLRKQKYEDTLAVSGGLGTVMGLAAAVFDPAFLIPAAGGFKAAEGVIVANKALTASKALNASKIASKEFTAVEKVAMGAFSDVAGVGSQEIGLQAGDPQRTTEESVTNIGLAVIAGGVLGAGHAGFTSMRAASKAASERAAFDLATVPVELGNAMSLADREALLGSSSAGAMRNIEQGMSRADMQPSGSDFIKGVIKNISGFTPNTRIFQSESVEAQRLYHSLAETQFVLEASGKGLEDNIAAVETQIRKARASSELLVEDVEKQFKDYRKSGGQLNREDFSAAVFETIKGTPAGDPYVAAVAKAHQDFYMSHIPALQELGILPQLKDGETIEKYATYTPALLQRDKVIKREGEFIDRGVEHLTPRIVKGFLKAASDYKQEIKQAYDKLKTANATYDTSASTLGKIQKALEKEFLQSEEGVGYTLAQKAARKAERRLAALERRNLEELGVKARQNHENLLERARQAYDDAQYAFTEAQTIRESALVRMEADGFANDFIRKTKGGERIIKENALDELRATAREKFIRDFSFDPAKFTLAELKDIASLEARQYFKELADKVARRASQGAEDATSTITLKTRGSLQSKRLNLPDDMIRDFGNIDVTEAPRLYGATMAPDIALRRAFDNDPRLTKQFAQVKNDFDNIRQDVTEAQSIAEIQGVLMNPPSIYEVNVAGKGVGKPLDLPAYREKALEYLNKQEKGTMRDLEAVRDRLRGNYRSDLEATSAAAVVRTARDFQFMRLMGSSVLSNITEAVKPMVVFGLRDYTNVVLNHMLKKTNAAAVTKEEMRVLNIGLQGAMHTAASDLPAMSIFTKQGGAEALARQGASAMAKYSGLNWLTNFNEFTSAFLTQNAVVKNMLSDVPLDAKTVREMENLGLTPSLRARIKEQLKIHHDVDDGLYTANHQRWDDRQAADAYTSAISKNVKQFVVSPTAGNTPLFMSLPTAKLLLQFRSYNIASFENVMLSGLQRDHRQFMAQLAVMSVVGAQVSMLKAMNNGAASFERWKNDKLNNPMELLAEGMDQSGMLALLFDIANTAEKVSGVNVLKDPVAAMNVWYDESRDPSRKKQQFMGNNIAQALAGPTLGQAFNIPSAVKTAGRLIEGDTVTTGQRINAQSNLPFASHPLFKALANALTSNTVGIDPPPKK